MQGDSDATLLLLPKDGVAASAGTLRGILERTAGDKVIFVLGDIPSVNSLIGPSMDCHELRGISKAGYLFRPDLELAILLLLESVANVVGSLARDGQLSSLKTVPFSLPNPDTELRTEPLLLPKLSPCELQGDGSVETGDTAVTRLDNRLCVRGAATNNFGFHVAGRPYTVLSLPSVSLSLFAPFFPCCSGSSIMVLRCLPRAGRGGI
jgi:hypothetical protein